MNLFLCLPIMTGLLMFNTSTLATSLRREKRQVAKPEESTAEKLDPSTVIIQGDMLSNRDELVNVVRRSSQSDRTKIWRSRVVPYTFASDGPGSYFPQGHKARIVAAMNKLSNSINKCITFREKQAGDVDVIVFDTQYGCFSYIGRNKNYQRLYVSNSCDEGSIMHEIMHALGFYHEQSRPDRDSYIKINWENVLQGSISEFEIQDHSDTQQGTYDLNSIMHYRKNAFTKNGLNTIDVLNNPNAVIGQRTALSGKDKEEIRRLYDCNTPKSSGISQWSHWIELHCCTQGNKYRQRFCIDDSSPYCSSSFTDGVQREDTSCECTGGTPGVPAPEDNKDNDFEIDLKSWTNKGELPFVLHVGETKTWDTGPEPGVDHTKGRYGRYVYMEAGTDDASVGPQAGQYATLQNIINPTKSRCEMSFWFNMHDKLGNQMGNLKVKVNGINKWQQNGNHGNGWIQGYVYNIPQGNNVKIEFIAERGSGKLSDICLDDIKFITCW